MKKKIFLAIFLIVSMAVPAFSFYWKDYDCYNEEDLKKYEDLITKEFYLIRDEIFAPKYPKIKDVEIAWDYSEEDWEKNQISKSAFYSGIERKVRITPYIKWANGFETDERTLAIIHELTHAVSPKSGHGKEFIEIFYKMTDEYLIRVFDGTLKSEMFTDLDFYTSEEGIEWISRRVEKDSEKKNLTIAKLKKKLGLKILR